MKPSMILLYVLLIYVVINIGGIPFSLVSLVLGVCLLVLLTIVFQKQPRVNKVLQKLKLLF